MPLELLLFVLPLRAGQLAGFQKRTGDRRPSESCPDLTGCRLAEASGKRAVAKQPDDGVCEGVRLVRNERIRAVGNPSTPIDVETMDLPMAMASNTLSLVPPPILSGITYTAARSI